MDCRRVSVLTKVPIEFGLIAPNHWHQPMWVDEVRAAEGRRQMEQDGIIYGGAYRVRMMSFVYSLSTLQGVFRTYPPEI